MSGCAAAALTRARKLVVVVGPQAAIEAALQGVQGDVRLSSLNERLAAAAASLGLARSAACAFISMSAASPP